MKLHEIPKNSKLIVQTGDGKDHKATFHHLDGMFSYCTIDDLPKDKYNIFHLGVMEEMVKVGNHYELKGNTGDK